MKDESQSTDNSQLKVDVNSDEFRNVMKKYKKIKKYMRSNLYAVRKLDGTEKIVSELLKEANNE